MKIEYNGDWQVITPKKILFNTKLSKEARFTWQILRSFCSENSPNPFPSLRYLAQIIGVQERTVQSYLKELVDARYLEKFASRAVAGRFSSNIYKLYDAPYAVLPHTVQRHAVEPNAVNHPTKEYHVLRKPIIEGNPKGISKKYTPDQLELIKEGFWKMFNRRPATDWSKNEIEALEKLPRINGEDFKMIYSVYVSGEYKFRRKDLATLLNNWQTEVDRVNQFLKEKGNNP